MKFKKRSDIEGDTAPPVHCDHKFDVWQDLDGRYFVIDAESDEKMFFATPHEARAHAWRPAATTELTTEHTESTEEIRPGDMVTG